MPRSINYQINTAHNVADGLCCYLFRTIHDRNRQHERNGLEIRRDQLRRRRHSYRQLGWRRYHGWSSQHSARRLDQSW